MASTVGKVVGCSVERAHKAAKVASVLREKPLRGPLRSRLPGSRHSMAFRNMAIAMPNESAQVVPDPKGVNSKASNSASNTQTWKCSIRSSAPLLGDTGTRLEIAVIDTDTELRSETFIVDSWRPPKEVTSSDGTVSWVREGAITLPAEMKQPGAVLIRKIADKEGPSVDFIGTIELISMSGVHRVNANSWVSSEHGWRVFFTGAAYLPKDTPISLTDERQRELEDLRGTPETRVKERKGADRIYWYQVYDDLSSGKDGKLVRPNLGGSKQLPYPRRSATNRGSGADGREKPPAEGSEFWLQKDDTFSFDKAADFQGAALQGGLNTAFALIAEAANQKNRAPINLVPTLLLGAARQAIAGFIGLEKPLDHFEDYADVLALFKKDSTNSGGVFSSLLPSKLYPTVPGQPAKDAKASHEKAKPFKSADGAWDFQLDAAAAAEVDRFTTEKRVGPLYDSATGMPSAGARSATPDSKPGANKIKDRLGSKLWNAAKAKTASINELLYFAVPRVLEGRSDAWHTDEEYGRQVLAGVNPCVISALTKLPESFGSAIRGEHVNAELQGATLEQLVAQAAAGAKPRLFMIDYWDLSAFWEAAAAAAPGERPKDMVQHAGRAVFYLRHDGNGNDTALVPIAIELAHPDTHKEIPTLAKTAGVVYARSSFGFDPQSLAVWRLAKSVFKSLDAAYHQLVSHYTRTHGVLEPFYIALKRQLSSMHPVFKLMVPHFRYTLQINRDARASLINSGGIIEKTFSAGPYAMQLAAVVYGKSWRFATEGLPEDLRKRGMVDAAGQPWMDYPYAEDGLDIWSATSSYFDKYLRLYYKSDQDVATDPELQAWWNEVKNEGHPDLVKFGITTEQELWGFAGPIPSIAKLVQVLTTVAWLASGHHAAVNFGQYDFSSLPLNTSSLIRRPMPAPGQKAYLELTKATIGAQQEGVIMTYLAGPITASTVASTVKLLSGHARDEHTLDEPNHQLVDEPAKAANEEYIKRMFALELDIEKRNADPSNWTRYGLKTDSDAPLPYTLLMPGSQAGVTMRGVPYSVSI